MTDTFQSAVLLGSLAAVLALGAGKAGGLDYVWDHARSTRRLHFFEYVLTSTYYYRKPPN